MIQTRSEVNGVSHHITLQDALAEARDDETIWKISFDISDGSRIRLVREDGKWVYQNVFTGNYND